jgi:hypothetical protein
VENTEGKRPDIRKQNIAELSGDRLGIPSENRNHPTVRNFLEVFAGATEVHDKLGHLAEDAPDARKEDVFQDQSWVLSETRVEAARHPAEESLSPNPDLKERYGSAALVMVAALEILQGGLKGDPTRAKYMRSKLNSALGQYGLEVVENIPIPGMKLPPTE